MDGILTQMGACRFVLGFLAVGLAWKASAQTTQAPQAQPLPGPQDVHAPVAPVVVDGEVITTSNQPLPDAEVLVIDSTSTVVTSVRSDSGGHFIIRGLGRNKQHLFVVRRIGFTPDTLLVTATALDDFLNNSDTLWLSFVMHQHPVPKLTAVNVVGKHGGFFNRIVAVHNKIEKALARVDSVLIRVENTVNKYCKPESRAQFCVGRPLPPLPRGRKQPPTPWRPQPDSQSVKTPVDSQPAG